MNLTKLTNLRRKGLKPKNMVNISMVPDLNKYDNIIGVTMDDDLSVLVGLAVEVFHTGDNRQRTAELINNIILSGADCVTALNLKTKQRLWVWDQGEVMFKNITGW